MPHSSFLFVDDSQEALDIFRSPLQSIMMGDLSCILHSDQSEDELLEQILALEPGVVLLDGYLAQGVKGYKLLAHIHSRRGDVCCIGFSSASELEQPFLHAGAKAFVLKETADPERSVQKLRAVLEDEGKL